MELFKNAKTIRLKSHHNKYLLADEDEEHVSQDRHRSSPNARWTVEFPETSDFLIRLKSCYGRYLTASNEPFLLGMTGRKVLQTLPSRLDSSVEWEPIRDGFQVKLKTRYGQFLRGNGGLPPWRNSITHDIPHRTSTQDWVLWDIEIVEVRLNEDGNVHSSAPPSVSLGRRSDSSPESRSPSFSGLSRDESSSSFGGSPHKSEGRSIYYLIAEDDGSTDSSNELCFNFKGTSVAELTEKLEEITEISDGIIVCSRNPLNQELCPLRLHLPPNNTTMHVIVVRSSSKAAKRLK